MPSQISNLVIDAGETFSTIIQLQDANGNPLSLTGYSGNSQMRKHYSSINVSATFVVSMNSSLGQITLSLDANTTGNLYMGRYVYDVFLTAGGVFTKVVEGQVQVVPAVTHS
jgi:hypothetical protein